MFWVRAEGEHIRNGLNVYPLSDPRNFGGILRIGRLVLRLRYSKITKKIYSSATVFNDWS
jgi:hypothetical protein